ncbi:unnamed protein product [Spirodela intermedia]|uniref:Uncharacterized protein n=1 Tax=Spirodela intermedia TaxID=51605 RepID=A0A7I8LGT0_SPIIN|nr:unnamed protein product [Spirodela intermedia]
MVSGPDSRPTSKESNDGQTGSDIGWRWCPLFVGEWGEAQEYLGKHHAMSRTHHNHYASVPRRESDSRRPCYAWMAYRLEEIKGGYYWPLKTTMEIQHKTDNKAHRNPLGEKEERENKRKEKS